MSTRTAESQWKGMLKEGTGTMKLGSGAYEGAYSFASRFEEAPGTNPEELIGAAHSGCFSMFLSALLSKEGLHPTSITTNAKVHLGMVNDAPTITKIELSCEGDVPGVDATVFQNLAEAAKAQCPVSKALAGTQITMTARLR